jgi:hypothetical protein
VWGLSAFIALRHCPVAKRNKPLWTAACVLMGHIIAWGAVPIGASYRGQAIQSTLGSSVSSLNHERVSQGCAQGMDGPVVVFSLYRVLVLACLCVWGRQYRDRAIGNGVYSCMISS